MGELFRDRHVLDYMTIDRINPQTLAIGLLFFLFALKNAGALMPEDLDSLHARFVIDTDQEVYWRAYWDGIRQVMVNFDTDALRNAILAQIQRTQWWRLYRERDTPIIIHILSTVVDGTKDRIKSGFPVLDLMPLIYTCQFLQREIFANDIEDMDFQTGVTDLLVRLFPYYPTKGEERERLANVLFQNATNGPMNQRGGDLQLLRALLCTETSEVVTEWKRDECISKLCLMTPSLPEVILGELAAWKTRQYVLGFQNAQRGAQIEFRVQFLVHVLAADKIAGGEYQFPRRVLEEFWNTALLPPEDLGMEQYWGGDGVTESIRIVFFHILANNDFRRHSALVRLLKIGLIVGCGVFEILY